MNNINKGIMFRKNFESSFNKIKTPSPKPLKGWVAYQFEIYKAPMSANLQKKFRYVLENLPGDGYAGNAQYYVFNNVTNYTAHCRAAGDKAKMRTGNKNIDNIVTYFEFLYDTDPLSDINLYSN